MLKHILAFTLIFCTANYAQEPGRTDGAEGSEFGRGGYRMSNIKNPWQIKVSFGSARVNSDGEFAEKREVTDLYYGLKLGYKLDSFDFDIGYSRIDQQNTDFLGLGITREIPFGGIPDVTIGFSLGSEIIKRDNVNTEFSIVSGFNAGIILGDRLKLGLDYRRSIVFSDYNVTVNRFGLSFKADL